MKDKNEEAVERLIEKSAIAEKSEDAMRFSQAAGGYEVGALLVTVKDPGKVNGEYNFWARRGQE